MRHARLVSLVVLIFTLGLGGAVTASAQDGPVWNNATIWQPSLPEAGVALSDLLNQIDAACNLDLDVVIPTAGSGPEGAVYAFSVTWGCPNGASETPENTWQSAVIWQPTMLDAGNALAEHLNQIDARCNVDVDTIIAANGPGPEGPVYAFVVTWAC